MSWTAGVAEACCRRLLAARGTGVQVGSSPPRRDRPVVALVQDPRTNNRYTLTIHPGDGKSKGATYRVIPARGQVLDTSDANRKILLTSKTVSIQLRLVERTAGNVISPPYTYKQLADSHRNASTAA